MDSVAHVLEGYAKGELRVQRCEACATLQFPPRAVCLACRSAQLAWTTCESKGTIKTFTVVHRAPTDMFKARVPYLIALIDCAQGVRLMMNVLGDLGALAIGATVEIDFMPTPDRKMRPVAKLTGAAPAD